MNRMPLFYLALGDSLTVGTGSLLAPGFVDVYRNLAEQTLQTRLKEKKLAKKGLMSFELGGMIKSYDVIRDIEQADIITITIGGNDLRYAWELFLQHNNEEILWSALFATLTNIQKIVNQIVEIKSLVPKKYILRIVNLYNPIRNPLATLFIEEFNRRLLFLERGEVKVADVYHYFLGREHLLLFIDGFHPNKNGHRVIAQALHELGYD